MLVRHLNDFPRMELRSYFDAVSSCYSFCFISFALLLRSIFNSLSSFAAAADAI